MSTADRAGSRSGRFVDLPKNNFGYFSGGGMTDAQSVRFKLHEGVKA